MAVTVSWWIFLCFWFLFMNNVLSLGCQCCCLCRWPKFLCMNSCNEHLKPHRVLYASGNQNKVGAFSFPTRSEVIKRKQQSTSEETTAKTETVWWDNKCMRKFLLLTWMPDALATIRMLAELKSEMVSKNDTCMLLCIQNKRLSVIGMYMHNVSTRANVSCTQNGDTSDYLHIVASFIT